MEFFAHCIVPGMGMPYMGYTPDGMMAPMAPMAMPGLTSGAATSAAAATQRKYLVAKAKNQRLG